MATIIPSIAKIARNQATMADIQHLEDADSLLKDRRKLPVYGSAADLLEMYHQNQVIILSSETGAGKSTQVPQILVYDEYGSNLLIACTQPRKLAAKTLARRVAHEMGVAVGETVGFQVAGESCITRKGNNTTRLSFMTEQVLVNQAIDDPDFSKYACVIVDEAHERTMQADTLMALLKRALTRRKDLKVIIMSATINAEKFTQYFNNCPVLQVPGRAYEVDIRHIEPNGETNDYVMLAANVVDYIHKNEGPGDILVFGTGLSDITEIANLVRHCTPGVDVHLLIASLSWEDQEQALNSSGPNRKCIVSTNVAETSLTVNNVVFIIDTGLSKQAVYNPRLRLHMLPTRPISRASAIQRAGRAGRTANGVCFRLYTEKTFNQLEEMTAPAMLTSPVDDVLLTLLAIGVTKLVDFDWLDIPYPDMFASALQDLHLYGLINDEGKLTKSGMTASTIQLSPAWFRAVEEAAATSSGSIDMIDLAVVCSSQKSIFLRPAGHEQVADLARAMFQYAPSDHLTLLNAFHQFERALEKSKSNKDFSLQDWCNTHYLDINVLEEVLQTRAIVVRQFKKTDIRPSTANIRSFDFIKALARAFCNQIAYLDNDSYRTVNTHVMARLSAHSCLLNDNAVWVMYTKLSMTGRDVEMDTVSIISLDWLLDLPAFQLDALAKKYNGTARQPFVHESIEAAKRVEAEKATPAATEEMSTPVTQLIEAIESFHLSDGLGENWEQKGSASDSVHRYFAALPDIHTYYQAIGVPSHLPSKNGLLMQGHGYASTIPGGTAEKKAQVNAEFIYIFRKVDPAKPFDQVPHQWTAVLRVENSRRPFEDETWAIACVPLEKAAALETEGWEV
ncbi:pre-mRNA splicing factor ATP-dependent RNA helicase PRP43 [Beauveria bassiana ARSEF 2860]|uniref:Pre-mRNA splicing factor ATP-dependent RNA helicase PRP43 n=1 Tax=Beauveria bassiana (strain ARSEF 2860) TaxID=655819 RepID=J5JAB7_BEAB2|nr:pre-mRNA splicing factor ATP-dependent RNA helicase PRP43 [Beauveria bassiana ARSEF 2860]EJP63143.1 pre-mRNA splicing factor ATP-dependent RNA helicase PRP43 [Beauveria bassiana ARSEF 2860]